MNQFNNHNSAFYSGPTRYGGAAAVAKRREAARKAFFAVKEVPTSSSREPAVPQLTSHAKKILSWIEENSGAQQETFQISKRNQRTKHRFNPMAYRAPILKPPQEKIIPALSSPPQLKKFDNNWMPPTLTINNKLPELKPLPAVEAPKSSRFAKVEFYGPSREVKLQTIEKKEFAPPRALTPPQDKPKTPQSRVVYMTPTQTPTPTVTPAKTRTPIPASTPAKTPSPVKAPAPISAPKLARTSIFAPSPNAAKTSPVTDVGMDKAMAVTGRSPLVSVPVTNSPAPSLPNATSIPPAVQQSSKPILQSVPAMASQLELKPLPVVEAPESSRFAKVKFYGPIREVNFQTVQRKEFAPSRDLTPPQDQPETPQSRVVYPTPTQTPTPTLTPAKTPTSIPITTPTPPPTITPAKAPTPTIIPAESLTTTITPAETPTPIQDSNPAKTLLPVQVKDPAPISVPKLACSPISTSNNTAAPTSPVLDVEMDVEMDESSALTGPSQPVSVPVTSTPTPLLPATTVISPVVQQSPIPTLPSAPAMASQPLFMPPPSFSTPTFTSPVAPVTTMSMPNGSNPFQPTSSTRGRKILRPARRLHR